MADTTRARAAWALLAVWLAAQLTATSLPGDMVPGGLEIEGLDKVVHVSMYLGCTVLLFRALLRSDRNPRLGWLLLGLAAFAALDEVHQLFIPGRDADVFDWLADTVGVSAGLWASILILKSKWHAWLE